MPRADPRFNAFDAIRLVERNLDLANKRLVFAWFFSTIPIKEPKVDVVGILLDLLSVIPVAGSFAALFNITLATAQVAADIAELFKFEFEEEEVELAKLKVELAFLREAFDNQREELLSCQRRLDSSQEQVQALLATQSLLEDEIRQLVEQGVPSVTRVRRSTIVIRAKANRTRELLRVLTPARERIFADNAQLDILSEVRTILETI